MTRKFNVGDRVRIIRTENPLMARFVGVETTVLGLCTDPYYPGQYLIDIPPTPPAIQTAAPPEHLKLIYDGDEPAKWSSCAWQPKRVST